MNDSRQYPDRPYVGVGAVIVQDGKVLLVKRKYEPLAGQWSLPGGAVEVGETLQACLVREMLEETGLEVSVGPVIEIIDRITRDEAGRVMYHFVLVDYLCWPTGGALRASSDVAEAVFANPHDLRQYDLTAKATSVVERALVLDRQTGGSRKQDPPYESRKQDPPYESEKQDPPYESGKQDPPYESGKQNPPDDGSRS